MLCCVVRTGDKIIIVSLTLLSFHSLLLPPLSSLPLFLLLPPSVSTPPSLCLYSSLPLSLLLPPSVSTPPSLCLYSSLPPSVSTPPSLCLYSSLPPPPSPSPAATDQSHTYTVSLDDWIIARFFVIKII